MKSIRTIVVGIIVLVAAVCFEATAFSVSGVGKLDSPRLEEREKAAEQVRREHAQLVQALVQLAREEVELVPSKSTADPEYVRHAAKDLAIILLGELRAAQGVSLLLDNLRYQNPNVLVISYYVEPGQTYSAVEALIKIGMPAVGPTIKKLGTYDKDGLDRKLCCWIIKKVLGPRLGRLRLEIAIEEVREPKVKKNLQAALVYFKTPEERAAEEKARRDEAKQP